MLVKKRQLGFSLVEAIVSIAVISIFAIGILKILDVYRKDLLNTQRNLEFRDVDRQIDMYLSTNDSCARLFQTTKIDLPLIDLIAPKKFNESELIFINTLTFDGSEIASRNVTKNGLTPKFIGFTTVYKSFKAAGFDFRYYVLDFAFQAEKQGYNLTSTIKDKIVTIFVKTDSEGNILSCGKTSASEEGRCIASGKTFDYSRAPFCQ